MIDGFYRAFEDKHRGSRALIKERQRVYLPLIQPLVTLYPDAAALDLGCGRGEWLELLVETGFKAQGIDLDDGMLPSAAPAACRCKRKMRSPPCKACLQTAKPLFLGFTK